MSTSRYFLVTINLRVYLFKFEKKRQRVREREKKGIFGSYLLFYVSLILFQSTSRTWITDGQYDKIMKWIVSLKHTHVVFITHIIIDRFRYVVPCHTTSIIDLAFYIPTSSPRHHFFFFSQNSYWHTGSIKRRPHMTQSK
jgi:hypothetical protein